MKECNSIAWSEGIKLKGSPYRGLRGGGGGGSFSDRPIKMKKTENLVKRVG